MADEGTSGVRVQKFGHACVRIDVGGQVLVIDSGDFSEPESIEGADALLFTHGHPDHISAERLKAAREANPSIQVWASEGAAALPGIDGVKILSPGSTVEVCGIDVACSGGSHASIYGGIDLGDNVALTVAGAVFHPGDSFAMPEGDIAVLLAPISAPWSRMSEVVDYIKEVSCERIVPIHEGLLNSTGIALFDRNVAALSGAGDSYVRLAPGESISF